MRTQGYRCRGCFNFCSGNRRDLSKHKKRCGNSIFWIDENTDYEARIDKGILADFEDHRTFLKNKNEKYKKRK